MSIENKYYSKIVIHHLVLDPLVIPIPNCHHNPTTHPPTSSRTSIGTSFSTFSGKPSTRRLFNRNLSFQTEEFLESPKNQGPKRLLVVFVLLFCWRFGQETLGGG